MQRLQCMQGSVVAADSMRVLAILLVVGVMDDARADIIGGGNINQSFVESLSQVLPAATCLHMHFLTTWVCFVS